MSYLDDPIALCFDSDKLKELLKVIPDSPGCYLMKDVKDNILYIGKSKRLRSRIRSYFQNKASLLPRISLMVRQIYDIEVIITDTEAESLTLESNLIKNNQPYFNVLLKDDKKYPYLCITWSDEYPRIYITRRRRNRNPRDRYYGPFVDVNALRGTLNMVKKIFPIRQRIRPLYKNKPCLNYSIGRCPGVCQKLIESDIYRETIKKISMIFEGRTDHLKNILKQKMIEFSDLLQYENALHVRNQISQLEALCQSQKMIDPDSSVNRDVIAFASNQEMTCIQLFQMRSGKLLARIGFTSDNNNLSIQMLLQKVIEEHYSNLSSVEIPGELLLETEIYNPLLIKQWLCELRGHNVKLIIPKRSIKYKLIKLVKKNAEFELSIKKKNLEKTKIALDDLSNLLELEKIPERIEGYDISHISGYEAVASQVVFINGLPAKNLYRKYKIKNSNVRIGHSDDYLSIEEVITRRFRVWSNYKKQGLDISKFRSKRKSILNSKIEFDLPDLIMIDGGKGQLNIASKTLKKLDLEADIRICSLAKKREEIFIPGYGQPIECSQEDPGLLLLRRLRDEAHRFALSFHQQRRSRNLRRSALTEIPGVGPKRIKLLLSHFNSVEAIQLAKKEDIAKVPGVGEEIACSIRKYFNEQ